MLKKFLARILLVVGGVSIILIGAEVYFWLFNPQLTASSIYTSYDFHCFIDGTYYPFALKPNSNCRLHSNLNQFKDVYIKTNSLGLRNPEIKTPKPKDTVRILFVGDSYTAGWGVEENEAFPRVAQTVLSQKFPQKKIEVINAGLPAAGPNYFYLFMKNEGVKLNPDIVVVGFWMVKHIPDNAYYTEWRAVDNDGLPTKVINKTEMRDFTGNKIPIDVPFKLTVPFLKYSHVFAAVADRLFPYDDKYSQGILISARGCLYKDECHDLDDAKAKTKKLFWGIKKITDGIGAKLLVAFIPAEFQLDRQARIKYGIAVPLLPSDKEYPYQEFGGFFAENGIDSLDMRTAFRDAKKTEGQFYFKTDNHWNAEGHRVAAEAVSDKLSEYLK